MNDSGKFYREEEDYYDDIEPERDVNDLPQPETSSIYSLADDLSANQPPHNQQLKPSKIKELEGFLPKNLEKPKIQKVDDAAVQLAMENNDFDQMVKLASLMITNISLKFSRLIQKIDENEIKLKGIEDKFFEQKGRFPKEF